MMTDAVKNEIRGWLKSTPCNKKIIHVSKKGLSYAQKEIIARAWIKKTTLPKNWSKCYRGVCFTIVRILKKLWLKRIAVVFFYFYTTKSILFIIRGNCKKKTSMLRVSNFESYSTNITQKKVIWLIAMTTVRILKMEIIISHHRYYG